MTYTTGLYGLSPQILWANWMSLGRIITLLVWMAHRLVSLNRPTGLSLVASCKAPIADPWNLISAPQVLANLSDEPLEG